MTNITPRPLSPTDKIYPPGINLDIKLSRKSQGKIHLPERTTRTLLSPLVEAYYSFEKGLRVTAIVFIAYDEAKDLDFNIYQNCYIDLDGKPKLQFFVSYDLLETKQTDFLVYEVTFNALEIPYGPLSDIKTIETFLWDIDPVTSRGTVTTVLDSN